MLVHLFDSGLFICVILSFSDEILRNVHLGDLVIHVCECFYSCMVQLVSYVLPAWFMCIILCTYQILCNVHLKYMNREAMHHSTPAPPGIQTAIRDG